MAANASNTSPHQTGNSLEFNKDHKEKMVILPKDLNIVWGNDSRYWNVSKDDNSTIVLNQVYWLEVTGSVDNTDPSKEYEVGFHLSLTPDAFGWARTSLYIMVKRGKGGKFEWERLPLEQKGTEEFDIVGKLRVTSEKNDNQEEGSEHSKIYFGIYEVWSGKWKGGLKVHHAFVKELP